MHAQDLVRELESSRQSFRRSTGCLREEHSGFRPIDGMFTVAQQVAHVARDIDWFLEGAFRPEGFDMDFDAHQEEVRAVASLDEARRWFERSFDAFIARIASLSPAELAESLPDGPILGGLPRYVIVGALVDHNAHHRGALTVYSRHLGLAAPMPYM